jgi:ribosomal protein S18 acetylase RimI-like enzyme
VTPPEVRIRPAREDDFAPIEHVYIANEPPPPGDAPAPAGWMTRYLDHLLGRGEMLVAELDGGLAGFVAVVDIGRAVHVADLFIDPDRHGQGIGGRLLRAALGDRWPRMTFSSDDPRAMPVYIKAGMTPRWPNLYIDTEGRPPPATPSGLAVRSIEPAEAAAFEQRFGGQDRLVDYRHWAGQPGGESFVVEDGGRAVAVGNARDRWRKAGRWIDRLILAPDADDLVGPVVASLEHEARGQPISIAVAGPHPVVPVLVGAGHRIYDKDTFMASEDGLLDPLRQIVEPGVP